MTNSPHLNNYNNYLQFDHRSGEQAAYPQQWPNYQQPHQQIYQDLSCYTEKTGQEFPKQPSLLQNLLTQGKEEKTEKTENYGNPVITSTLPSNSQIAMPGSSRISVLRHPPASIYAETSVLTRYFCGANQQISYLPTNTRSYEQNYVSTQKHNARTNSAASTASSIDIMPIQQYNQVTQGYNPYNNNDKQNPNEVNGYYVESSPHIYPWMRSSSNKKRNGKEEKRTRQTYARYQTLQLEAEYHTNKYLAKRRRVEISHDLGLTERQIKIWFQNRRMKEKKGRGKDEPKISSILKLTSQMSISDESLSGSSSTTSPTVHGINPAQQPIMQQLKFETNKQFEEYMDYYQNSMHEPHIPTYNSNNDYYDNNDYIDKNDIHPNSKL